MRLFRIASLLLAAAVSAPAHAVVTTSTRSTEITGTGGTVFTVPFPFADAASLVVKKILLSTGASTTLTLGTGYTVTLPVGTVSGKVTTTASVSSSYKLRIERSTPTTQTTAFGSQGAFNPALHEKALDKLTMALQDVTVSGGSGSSGTPSDSTPAAVSTTATAGAATTYSRGDHAHAITSGTINSAVGTNTLDGNARVFVRKNSTGSVLSRRRLNLIEGSNVTLTMADDSGSEEVDVTIASAGGGGTVDFASVNAALATANASIDINGHKVTNLATPTASSDAVSLSYLADLVGDPPWKYAVRAATTVTNGLTGNVTIDGVALAFPDRILVKNQITTSQNGIYVVSSGAWSRATDADEAGEFTTGMSVWVSEGTTQSDTLWALNTNDPITVGSTSLAFTQVDQKAITASNGLQRTFNNILVAPDGIDASMLANMAANTIKGRITGSTGNPEDLTAANVRTIISAVSGSSSAYLDGTGNFSTPSGGGSSGSGAWKDPVRLATTANITLSGAQTIDGVSAIANDRVLVKNQTAGAENGIYAVASGAWTRVTDMDVNGEVYPGQAVMVQEGTANADTGWVLTTNAAITLDTTALTFSLIHGLASSATPGAVSTTGAVGTATTYARGDHVHAITAATVNSAVTGTGLDVTGAASTAGLKGTGGATNASGVEGVGAGTGSGVKGTGGATGKGVEGIGGSTSGAGVTGTASAGGNVGVIGNGNGSGAGVTGTGGSSGRGGDFTGGASTDGLRGTGGTTSGKGVVGAGTGTGVGVQGTGGATGAGVTGIGGSTSGAGGTFTGTAGNANGVTSTGQGSGAGVAGTGGATGTGVTATGGSTSGYGAVIAADTTTPVSAALAITPQDTQPSGPNVVGDIYVTTAGVMKVCTVAGTPGTWISVGDSTTNATVTLTGDVTGSGTGSFAATVANDAITYAKIQNVSATDKVLGRSSSGAGDVEEIAMTAAGRALVDDAAASDQRTTLGLGTLATQSGTFSGTSSGTNTGDQTITLTGDVTGSGTGSFAATVANDAVTNAKAANMANATIKCRTTAGTGDPEDCTAAQTTALLNVATTSVKGLAPVLSNVSTEYLSGTGVYSTPAGGGGLSDGDKGDITVGSSGTTLTIDNDVVTYAKMQNVSATDKLLGRSTAGAGDVEEIALTSAGRALIDDADAAAQRVTLGVSTLWTKQFAADMFLPLEAWTSGSPHTAVTAAWEVANLVNTRAFDQTTAEGVGLEIVLPTGAANINLSIDQAAKTSGFTTSNGVQWTLCCRPKYGTGSFVCVDGAALTMTDNATIQRKTQTWTTSGLSLTAGTVAICELARDVADADDTLTRDLVVTDAIFSVDP